MLLLYVEWLLCQKHSRLYKGGHMRFVDELNSMNNKHDVSKDAIKENLRKIHAAIRRACKEHNSRRQISGYLVIKYDNEYCVDTFSYIESLYRDNTGNLSLSEKYVKNGNQYPANLVSDEYHQHRSGFKPISKKDECRQYIDDLYKLLSEDGFKDICLETVACYDEHDEVIVSSGLFHSQRKLVRKPSNILLGYVIRVSLNW